MAEMIPVYGMSKIWLEVRQLGRAIHFYRDVVRLPLVAVKQNMAFFDIDGQQLVVTEPRVFPDGSVAGTICHWAMALDAEDEDWYAQKVRESGGKIYPISFGQYIDDPDGNLVEFWKNSRWTHPRRGPLAGAEIAPLRAIVETALMVVDSAKGLNFYRNILGLGNLEGHPESGEAFMRARLPSGQDILLFRPGTFMGVSRGGRNMHLTLACESVEAVVKFLEKRSIETICLDGKVYFSDPFGHRYEVEAVDEWPLPPSGNPSEWSYPKRPTDAME
jgi:predicted enzyme related to lactoylglutathione lyase